MKVAPHEFIHPALHGRRAADADDAAFDALTARVLATPDGKRWMAELLHRDVGLTMAVANWRVRIGRMRERWRTGSLTPG